MEILVGPIASGKSTYCKKLAKEGAIILNDDSIVTAVHGGDYTLYNKDLKPLYKTIENTIICTCLAMKKKIIIDRPNYSLVTRRRYISLAKSFDEKVTLVLFKKELPEIHAKRRYESDARGHDFSHWLEVAKYHDSLYEEPNKELEFFDEIVYI